MWFITAMDHLEDDEQFIARTGAQRTWGYYMDKEMAVRALHENWTDMWEYTYDVALLEKFGPGICPECQERQWFRFDRERGGYFEIEEPEFVKCIVNFALG